MPAAGIMIRRDLLDAERPCANEQVREMAVSFLKSLAPPVNDSLAAETARMIDVLLKSSDCTATETAQALGLHMRALQRRLQREGTTFDAVKDGVRRSLAERMLQDPDIPITHVALSLHYANISSFTRSCRRWFGDPPSIVRQRLAGGSGHLSGQAEMSYQSGRRRFN
jgi:AraC-like DNA-binding protein